MNVLFILAFLVGFALKGLILYSLFGQLARRYPVLFAYVFILLVTGVVDAALYFGIGIGSWSAHAVQIYWRNEAIRQIFLFLLVLSLVYLAMAVGPKRLAVQRLLIIGSLGFALVTYYGIYDIRPSARMSTMFRNLSFCAAILNLGLWGVLVRRRQRDSQMLLLSGGLGLQMTGEALGHSLRMISRSLLGFGDIVMVLSHLLCLLAWWQALRPKEGELEIAAKRSARNPFDDNKKTRYTGSFRDAHLQTRVP